MRRKRKTRIKYEPLHKVHPEENYFAVGGRGEFRTKNAMA